MADQDGLIAATATRQGLSPDAVRALWDALVRGGGRQAQFSHPDLGGMGQWSGGDMAQIGDMFNGALKAQVSAACRDLADAAGRTDSTDQAQDRQADAQGQADSDDAWWPGDLGRPASTGAQNGSRYAVFPQARRLAVDRDGTVTVYDTGEHRIFGAAQQQGGRSSMTFSSQSGAVSLDNLGKV